MSCKPDPFPWWTSLCISTFFVVCAFLLGIIRWVIKIYWKHQHYKRTQAVYNKRYFNASMQLKKIQRTFSVPSVFDDKFVDNSKNYYDEDLGNVFDDKDVDLDEFTDSDENVIQKFDCNNPKKKFVYVRQDSRISQQFLISDFSNSDDLIRSQTKLGKSKSRLSNGFVLKSLFSFKEEQFDEDRSNHIFKWLWPSIKHSRLGMSARQQLNMKLYCEQYTTISYPAGKIMVS